MFLRRVSHCLIRFYQRFLSFDRGLLRFLFPYPTCRFTPTCSEYCRQAIIKYGILAGSWKGLLRFLRCHPGNSDGLDPLT